MTSALRSIQAGFRDRAGVGRRIASIAILAALSMPNDASATEEASDGERLRLIISRDEQRMDVYRGAKLITSSPVSTGKKGYATPLGVYSILGKRRWHRSNIYSRAPMPFMQRLTWSGIALHEGRVPGYPASHGCIRLPKGFAVELFGMTQVGVDVIVTSTPDRPKPINHATLFQPAVPDIQIGSHGNDDEATPVAINASFADVEYSIDKMQAYEARSTKPLRILITRRTGRQRMMDVQRMLLELGHDPGEIDGYLGSNTGRAMQSFQRSLDLAATGMVTDEMVSLLYGEVGRPEIRGHLYVRQNYKDLFGAPVTIRDIEKPLGTHVYSIGHFEDGAERANWTSLSIDTGEASTAMSALDRVSIPDELRARISEMLTPGSSLVIADSGLGKETGKGTDFIVQPRKTKKKKN